MSTVGMTHVTSPVDVEVIEPPGEVEIVTQPKDLSDSDIAEYARRTGVETITVKVLARRSVMGELIQKLGAAKIGSSMLIDSETMIQDGIKICDQMLQDYAHDLKLVGSIMKARLGFTELWVKTAQTHIKSVKDVAVEVPIEKPLVQPFPPPNLSQTNIYVNGVPKDDYTQ